MSTRALVVSVKSHKVTLLLPGGHFKQVTSFTRRWSIGEEYTASGFAALGNLGRAAGAVAAASLLLLGANTFLSHPMPQATAVISLDLNPSINMVVGGSKPVVIQAMGLDPQGLRLLSQASIIGMPVVQAVNRLMHQAKGDDYLTASTSEVVLGGVFSEPRAPWFALTARNIKNILSNTGHWHGDFVVVSRVSTQPLAAIASGPSSVGRVLLWGEAHPGQKMVGTALVSAQNNPLNAMVTAARIASAKSPTPHQVLVPPLADSASSTRKVSSGGVNPASTPAPVNNPVAPAKAGTPAPESKLPGPLPPGVSRGTPSGILTGHPPAAGATRPAAALKIGSPAPTVVPPAKEDLSIVQTVTVIGPAPSVGQP